MIVCVCVSIRVHIYVCGLGYVLFVCVSDVCERVSVCVSVCVFVCIRVHIYECVFVYVNAYVKVMYLTECVSV